MLLLGIFVFFLGLMALSPMVMKCQKKSDRTTSLSNAKQVFLLLVEFDQDYGEFPSDRTADSIPECKNYKGKYSNDYLGQFLAAGYVNSEEIFYAKTGSPKLKWPNNDFSTREKTLEEGECGFAYIKGLSMKSHLETPVLMTPMIGDSFFFDPYVYEGKALALRVDGSVKTLRISQKGGLENKALIGGGKTLFDGGADSVWGVDGFDSKNLCYAKFSYTPVEPGVMEKMRRKISGYNGAQIILVGVLIILLLRGAWSAVRFLIRRIK